MSEEPKNWWEITPEEGKEEVGDSSKPVMISGYEKDGDQWVQRKAKDTVVPSSADSSRGPFSDWFPEDSSNYSKQHAAATALFFFSFLVGDWKWDGSNGFGALMTSITAVLDMPFSIPNSLEYWSSVYGFGGILIVISWTLWDMTPLVFFLGFVLSWRTDGTTIANPITEVTSEALEFRRQSGKSSYRFLIGFAIVLIVMDFLQSMVWSSWDFFQIINYPTDFFSSHFWKVVAFLAVLGLNPDNDLWERFTSQ